MPRFEVVSEFTPKGDQQQAIDKLSDAILTENKFQTLLGVTGSGKTYTMAKVIEAVQRSTLIISHNKTLAAQLFQEFKEFFPNNAVEYYVSYYDYFQPEAYLPQYDRYIEKDFSYNEQIDMMRNSTTRSLLERRDVIVIASVSCIFSIGSPEHYKNMGVSLRVGDEITRERLIKSLIEIQYDRSHSDLYPGVFRARGDTLDVFPIYDRNGIRVEWFGDEIEQISEISPLAQVLNRKEGVFIFPRHHVVPKHVIKQGIKTIKKELEERHKEFLSLGKFIEAQRIEERTHYDIEMMRETGRCPGIENYSFHFDQRKKGEPSYSLLDFFPPDYLLMIDETHVTIPQLKGMYFGDRSRKQNLVDFGFRLPSAYENRPLKFDEFEGKINQITFISATPDKEYSLMKSEDSVVEQLIRPTGLVDPEIVVKPTTGQIDDLMEEIQKVVETRNERVLVTTLTKRNAENLADYFRDMGIRVRYLHSEIDTLERTDIIRELRLGEFDVLVGINLLREGLDLPEVSLVAILDADKQGFLRTETSLIQTIGRASRNINGRVVMYADRITEAMDRAIEETNRRRRVQAEFNESHGIVPQTILKEVSPSLLKPRTAPSELRKIKPEDIPKDELEIYLIDLEKEMKQAARVLEFERAAALRDLISQLRGTSDS